MSEQGMTHEEAVKAGVAEKRAEAKRKAQAEQLVVPHWPRKSSVAERIGNSDDLPVPGCDAVWIHLRARGDAYGPRRYASNVGIYVWFSGHRKFQIEVKGHRIHSATEQELSDTLKLVKELGKRMPAQLRPSQDVETWEPLHVYLPRLMQAFGITHCVQYTHGGTDSFEPIYLYLEDLNKDIQRRITRMARV
jgi:hypothetical protein